MAKELRKKWLWLLGQKTASGLYSSPALTLKVLSRFKSVSILIRWGLSM
jgi:hypothetical protein